MLGHETVGIAQIARETGLTRQTVYRIKGDPAGAEGALVAFGGCDPRDEPREIQGVTLGAFAWRPSSAFGPAGPIDPAACPANGSPFARGHPGLVRWSDFKTASKAAVAAHQRVRRSTCIQAIGGNGVT
jgi:hypothetical protein